MDQLNSDLPFPYHFVSALGNSPQVASAGDRLVSAIDEGTLDISAHLFSTAAEPEVTTRGWVFRSVVASTQQDLTVPLHYSWIKLPSILEIPVEADYPALHSAEMIRNLAMVEDYYKVSGAAAWAEEKFKGLVESIKKVTG
jgi:hypothetical protein